LDECTVSLDKLRAKFGEVIDAIGLTAIGIFYLQEANRPDAHTLATDAQLDNVRTAVETVLAENVPGDLIEAGVFRGGQTIWMRGVLKACGVVDRKVFVADSFEGLPAPDATVDLDDAIAHELLGDVGHFRVEARDVRANFAHYGLLDDQVQIVPGWFAESLPKAPIDKLAVMRLDGDYYASTRDALNALYPHLSIGGFAIIDDYGLPIGCKRAVDAYRQEHGITEELQPGGAHTFFWRRAR
jgi:hypothetical protein